MRLLHILIPIIFSFGLQAQHQSVYPALTGQELLDSLVAGFKSSIPLDQADGRDTLFGVIDNHNDSLTCVYSGFTIYLDPAEDPTQAAFMNGGPDAINTEHTYPQSLGATGIAKGDLHHLFPTRQDVNADRGNLPFDEIPDDEAESWYHLDQEQSSVPLTDIDQYSERNDNAFEPPEAHKGNVARAMFYFYTMYKDQADMANSSYFELQRQTLCSWHFADPVDQDEWDRTWLIAEYQEGNPNPFVLDCTLPERSYCSDALEKCTPVAVQEQNRKPYFHLDAVWPNPFSKETVLEYSIDRPGKLNFEIYNIHGQLVDSIRIGEKPAGVHRFGWEKVAGSSPGILLFRLIFETENNVMSIIGKLMVKP